MAVTSGSKILTELQIPKKWKERETSPERTKVWTEPKLNKTERKVPVVYYLSRNGQLEHPHFMEVPLSSPQGLYLIDVINRLNHLRGKGMAAMYSWSSKRSYNNGFVWHDLAENDFIYPAHGKEYILKGSEIVDPTSTPRPSETASLQLLSAPEENQKSGDESVFPVVTRRRNQSWSSIDLQEYKVYKSEAIGESAGKVAADASTQTDDKRRRRRGIREEKEKAIEEVEGENSPQEICHNQSTELSREEISPPPSDSSPETLETLMKADKRLMLPSDGANNVDCSNQTAQNYPSGRMKASSVLMQLISCGSVSFRDNGPATVKDQGFSLIGHYKSRLPRGAGNQVGKEVGTSVEIPNLTGLRLEDKEYFSGSLIETKKLEVPSLKRSSSYNADRASQLLLVEQETEGSVRAKCIPRKPKTLPIKKEASSSINSQQGRKRTEV
ncbi:protein UPSTREAM OF FLC [Quillaja saponaria]|uniref:Protein UPSTREAM OF FLC n=1 Tax=Quillaja saponaria TaxID=32244 RepID=A0AAD7PAI9_QUISA|nr:protein UPSTREAM OF FLC [Quillaja saponaria]